MTAQEGDEALNRLLQALDVAAQVKPPENPDDAPLDGTGDDASLPGSGEKKFEGAEHRSIGDNITLYDITGKPTNPPASDYVITSIGTWPFKTEVTYGRIISMAGDFYSNPDNDYAPICGAYDKDPTGSPYDRFQNMVTAMLGNAWTYAKSVRDALDEEKAAIDKRMGPDGGGEAAAYHSGDDIHGDAWYTTWTYSTYPKLAWQNADHFGNDAVFCYKVGHALACRAAIEAGLKTNNQDRTDGLKKAYFIEAACNHYLTDLFSSGHLRTPRRAFHYDNYKTMSIVGLAGTAGFLPVWDAMCRVMHDDDNATGLLCTNGDGERWIAFGDKNLFMPANGVNRVRCVYTVQKSVDEVFSYFQNPKDPSGVKKTVSKETAFATLNLIPKPLPDSRKDSDSLEWLNTLMNNPAPLWVPDNNMLSKDQHWSYRKQNDNHSAYAFADGRPGFQVEEWDSWTSRPECTQIYGAPFRGDDQYPPTKSVEVGGGLMQLYQTSSTWLDPGNKQDWVSANCWLPARFPGVSFLQSLRSITLRSKMELPGLYHDKGADKPMVHSLGWFDGSKTVSVVFRHPMADLKNANTLVVSLITFSDPNGGKPGQFDITLGGKQSQIVSQAGWLNKSPFAQAANTSVDMMDMRCLPFHDQNLARPRILTVVCGDSTAVCSQIYLDDGSVKDIVLTVDPWIKKDSPNDPDWPIRPFLKASTAGKSRRKVLFCQRSAISTTNNKWKLRVACLEVVLSDGSDNLLWNQNFIKSDERTIRAPSSSSYAPMRSSCFLVGDLIGTGKWPIGSGDQGEQVTSVTISPTYTQFDTIGYADGQPVQWLCTHGCADDLKKGPANSPYEGQGYLRDYFIAVIPSQYPGGAGCDVLHVSLHKFNYKYYLKFKTHVNDRSTRPNGGFVQKTEMDYFGSCNVNWIQDDFMSKDRYESGRYQSLKWLFMPHADASKKNAIMEVFSWYGILGLRYFAAQWDGKQYNYDLVGVQPYNGQTSGTIGRGFYGTWGEGFIATGTTQNFIDVNYYNMVLGGEVGQGYWDSAKMDTKKWKTSGVQGSAAIRRESDFVRGVGDDITKLEP